MAGDCNMATYEVVMPSDYLHILNCICIYNVKKTYKCYNAGDTWRSPATRLTADMYSQVLDNFWNKPTYKRPYYYIHNVNTSNFVPTNPYGERLFNQKEIGANDTNEVQTEFIKIDNSRLLILLHEGELYTISMFHGGLAGILSSNRISPITVLTDLEQSIMENTSNLSIHGTGGDNDPLYVIINGTEINLTDSNGDIVELVHNYSTIEDVFHIVGKSLKLGVDSSSTSDSSTGKYGGELKSCHEKYGDGNTNVNYGTDAFGAQIVQGEGLPRTIDIMKDGVPMQVSNIERGQALRYGNVSQVRLEIRYGTDNQVFELKQVYVDYIKAPQNIRLTQQEIDLTEDTSQMLEYPDYVCQEIINELVHLVMENISDQRLQTHPVVTQSIANPAQAQAPQAQGQSAQ